MDTSLVHVSSAQLETLQDTLNQLSTNLKETYNLLSQDLSALGEDWRDDKYDEFDQEFKSSREEILNIAEKYEQWANSYLPPRIDVIKKAEGKGMGIR